MGGIDPHYLALLHSMVVVKGFGKSGEMHRQPNGHQHVEDLV